MSGMNAQYIEILLDHYMAKKAVNQSYSMNAFARDISIRPSQLSEVLRKKKGLSVKSAQIISNKLKLKKQERTFFIESVIAECARSPKERDLAKSRLRKEISENHEMTKAEFSLIKDWLHFAVLEYIRIKKNNFKITAAADYFSVPTSRVNTVLTNLETVGLVQKKGNQYIIKDQTVFAPQNVPLTAKKIHHLKHLKLSMGACINQDYLNRDYITQTIAIESAQMPEIKKMIKEFHVKLNRLLASNQNSKDAVYAFSTQFFSLNKAGKYE